MDSILRLDLGCGAKKKEGYIGVDIIPFPGVDIVTDLKKTWPWPDSSVDEIWCAHLIEHLSGMERIHFANETHRVLKMGGKATIATPHWASCRAYGDPTHVWPPVSEFWYLYLAKDWRLGNPAKGIPVNAAHADASLVPGMFNCDFDVAWGYNLHGSIQIRNQEYQTFAAEWYKEAIQDIIATITKK